MKRPAFQFYPSDWRADTALQSCSLSAQGLWINLIAIAHDCTPYGHLVVNGRPMPSAQIARLVGLSGKECDRLLAELSEAGVTSLSDTGAIYSRRMVRDEDLRNRRAEGGHAGAQHGVKGAEHGSKGGRPRKRSGDEQPPKDEHARGVSEPPKEPPPSSSSSSSTSEKDISEPSVPRGLDDPGGPPAEREEPKRRLDRLPGCPFERLVESYHEVLPELPKVRVVSPARKRVAIKAWGWVLSSTKPDGSRRAETQEQGLAWFAAYFKRARCSDFVMGRGARSPGHENWRATFDYLLSEKGLRHVVENTEAKHGHA